LFIWGLGICGVGLALAAMNAGLALVIG